MKDLGVLTYFLGLEISKNSSGCFVSYRKYSLDFLNEFEMGNSKPLMLPLDKNVKLRATDGTCLINPTPYRTLVGKLIDILDSNKT